jgi:hypothetical protein
LHASISGTQAIVGFAASGCSSNEDIPAFRNVLEGSQPLNKVPVQLASRSAVNCGNVILQLFKGGIPNNPLQTVILSVGIIYPLVIRVVRHFIEIHLILLSLFYFVVVLLMAGIVPRIPMVNKLIKL